MIDDNPKPRVGPGHLEHGFDLIDRNWDNLPADVQLGELLPQVVAGVMRHPGEWPVPNEAAYTPSQRVLQEARNRLHCFERLLKGSPKNDSPYKS